MDQLKIESGQVVSSRFNPGVVAASYFVSFSGCYFTVELLNRRGSGLGTALSWAITGLCAFALGDIGTWCMHFIGNRAIILGDGTEQMQLVYDPGFTGLSVVIPLMGLMLAFVIAEIQFQTRRSHLVALSITGMFAGMSIVSMHYVGNLGITNYSLQYRPQYVAASIIIALGDFWIVLMLFYIWRDKWINQWWKRLLCAGFLAAGISAMHFTASTKCIYRFKHYNKPSAIARRNANTIIAAVSCVVAVTCCFFILWWTRRRIQTHLNRSKQITVACVMFDRAGRIIVSAEGTIPLRKITEKYLHRSFGDDFDISHPVFHWMFRISRNWHSVAELIPRMDLHYNSDTLAARCMYEQASHSPTGTTRLDEYSTFSMLFRQVFCVAAASMATSLRLSVDEVGILYDQIIDTGVAQPNTRGRRRGRLSNFDRTDSDVLETDVTLDSSGKGQLLVLTREVTFEEAQRLANIGMKPANTHQVNHILAEQLQISGKACAEHISDIRSYLHKEYHYQRSGTFLAVFALIPNTQGKGFDVTVLHDAKGHLPDVPLLSEEPWQWQIDFFQKMHGMSFERCTVFLRNHGGFFDPFRSAQETHLATLTLSASTILQRMVPQGWLQRSRFHANPLQAHYSTPCVYGARPINILAFVLCTDLHTPNGTSRPLARVPFNFLNVRHMSYAGSPNFDVLTGEVLQEFIPLLAERSRKHHQWKKHKLNKRLSGLMIKRTDDSKTPSRGPISSWFGSLFPGPRSSDVIELVHSYKPHITAEDSSIDTLPGIEPNGETRLGGILVNSKTIVEANSKTFTNNDRQESVAGVNDFRQTNSIGNQTKVGTVTYAKTFVDELMEFAQKTISRRVAAW